MGYLTRFTDSERKPITSGSKGKSISTSMLILPGANQSWEASRARSDAVEHAEHVCGGKREC